MEILFLILFALTGLVLIGLVLLQQSKGSDIGAAFGSGAAGAIFGPVGPGNILARITAVLAAVFFAMSLGLAWHAKQSLSPDEIDSIAEPAPIEGSAGTGLDSSLSEDAGDEEPAEPQQ